MPRARRATVFSPHFIYPASLFELGAIIFRLTYNGITIFYPIRTTAEFVHLVILAEPASANVNCILAVSLYQLAQPVEAVVVAENVLYSGEAVNY